MATETLRKTSVTTEKLLEHIQVQFSSENWELIKRACAFAEEYYAHIVHPIGKPYNLYAAEVANKLLDLHADPTLISAALICPPPHMAEKVFSDLRKIFKGETVLVNLVNEILHLNQLELSIWPQEENETKEAIERKEILQKMFLLAIDENLGKDQEHISSTASQFQKKEKQIENLIGMVLTAATDIHALIFKLVDRLHFIKQLKDVALPQKKAIHFSRHAKITLAIYAPLADRLGLWSIKSELEDMSFRLLQPNKYKEIANQLDAKKDERKKHINDIIPIIRNQIEAFGIQIEVSGRAKHIYSIYQKMEAKQLDIEEINDLLGIRIIAETKEDCYNVLGILHDNWLPITIDYGGKAGRDWIAHPKENLYQSLHTTIDIEGKIVEVQIRTRAMHEIAEYGASSAHWRYKENKAYRKGKIPHVIRPKDLVWSEQLAKVRKGLENEQVSAIPIQNNLLKDRIFVITPEGHVIDLASGATALDFAYRVHTNLGHMYIGAKVGGRFVRADYGLKNGEIIEVFTSRTRKGPNPEWLSKSRLDDELKSKLEDELKSKSEDELNKDDTIESSSHSRKGSNPQWLYQIDDEDEMMYYLFARTRQARSKIRRWLNQHDQEQKPKTQK